MNRPDIDLVFGRGRRRMVTGNHVEVFREESQAGEGRRYSKRFLATAAGDFRHWTEREGHILTRLTSLGIAPVPRVEQFDRGAEGRPALLRTCDAGVTVDHWATLLPVQRDGTQHRHVFEDCAHWWALARHCLMALDTLHGLRLVHLDLKADNVCIPMGPADFDPGVPGATMTLCFERLAVIDFAFSLSSGESPGQPLPIAHQTEYDYQSPRLLKALEAGRQGDLAPTRQLDWRCDVFSLAAMLRRYLPGPEALGGTWTPWHLEEACNLIRRLLDAHDANEPALRPHRALIALTELVLADAKLSASLGQGWALAADGALPPSDLATPVTRIAMPASTGLPRMQPERVARARSTAARAPARRAARAAGWIVVAAIGASLLGAGWWAMQPQLSREHNADAALKAAVDAMSAAPSLPAPKAEPAQALPPEPPPVAATQPAPGPVELEAAAARPTAEPEAPAASTVAATAARETAPVRLASAPAPTPAAAARTKAAMRSRTATSSPVSPAAAAGRLAVNQAERERVLEWLSKRGPSPRPDMTLPPAPATAPASAAKP